MFIHSSNPQREAQHWFLCSIVHTVYGRWLLEHVRPERTSFVYLMDLRELDDPQR